MTRFAVDLHNHSCLSPCAEDELTPGNLAGMAALAGIDVMALTDHNSVKNCPSFFAAAKNAGIVPVAGMELTTMEDIHVVCLFEHLSEARAFGNYIEDRRIRFPNRPGKFGGRQILCDETDEDVGDEPDFLPNATDLSYDQVPPVVKSFRGVCWPAHIDREANSVVAVLGTLPETPVYPCVEFYRLEQAEAYMAKYPSLKGKRLVTGSDSHFLTAVRDPSLWFEADVDREDPDAVRKALFAWLRQEEPR